MKFFLPIFRTLSEAKGAIGVGVLLFAAGAILGALFSDLSQPMLASLQAVAQELAGLGAAELALRIFARNATAAVIAVLAGSLFGVVPALAAVGNGLLTGGVLVLVPGEVWKVLPHGIFELPAIFAAWGLGLWIGLWPFGPDRLRRLRCRLIAAVRALFGLIFPLLVVAAVIEAIAAVHLYRSL